MPEGVPTVGDPGAMRELARQLDARAGVIGSTGNTATAPLDDAIFEGRAADRLRGSMSDARSQVFDAATQLREVARRLLSDADEVERQNERLAEQAEREREAKEQAAKEAAGDPQTPGSTQASTPTSTPTSTPAADAGPAPSSSTTTTVVTTTTTTTTTEAGDSA